jgi:hypothetical protein
MPTKTPGSLLSFDGVNVDDVDVFDVGRDADVGVGVGVGSGGIKILLHLYSPSLLMSSNETKFRVFGFVLSFE